MIRVLLADQHQLFRSGLRALLDRESDLHVVADVACGDSLADTAARTMPAVAILERDLPEPDGIRTAAWLRQTAPDTAVLLLASAFRPGDLERGVAAGAMGYLVKDITPNRLISAIREVAGGQQVFDPRIVMRTVHPKLVQPTARELEVLARVAAGDQIAEIARTLGLSSGTVRNYISSVIAKTNARNRCDAIRIASEAGWL